MPIHPTAIVHPSARLAEGVEVHAYAIIEADVEIGAGTVVGPFAVIGAGTRMGCGNRIYASAQVGVAPQDLKHLPGAVGKTIIGDNNIIREFVTISSSTVYGKEEDAQKATRIGNNCLLMATAHVAHDCVLGDGVIMANGAALAGHVTVQDRVSIGGLAGIHQFCVLGTHAFIGGMSRISQDVLPYMLIEGNPAKCYGPNTVGLQRAGFTSEQIQRIRRMYKLLYRSQMNTTQAVERIQQEIPDCPERQTILNFIAASKRGLT